MHATRQSPAADLSGHTLSAPLLTRLIAEIDPDQRIFVIDLGGLRAGTLSRLQALRCRLDVLDLDVESLQSEESEDPRERLKVRLAERLPAARGELADLLLCWNYLNYFSIAQIGSLMEVLLSRLSERARIHALIESSALEMPASPAAVELAEDGLVRVWEDGNRPDSMRRPAPRHSTSELISGMPGLVADQTMLLANGQKEIVFFRR